MNRGDIIMRNACLCDHVELLARQLRLYVQPDDTATRKMVKAALRAVRKAKRAK